MIKWIGQHIWDFVSRFRNDVYLESLTTTTESNVLVVDSDGKVSKSTSVGGDITGVTAGTNCSGGGTTGNVTINVDDAFLINSGDDETSGTITAGGFTTTGTWTFDEYSSGTVGITTVQDSGTTFNDNDTSLMTAAAIDDRILSYNYTTNLGDITGVDLTGGTGIEIASETNTTSGNYSATINCDLEGTELKSTGETGTAKFLRIDGDGTCSWQVPSYIADTQLSTEAVQDIVGGMFSSNTETLCTVTYEDGDGTIDIVVDNDLSNYDNSSSGFITSTLTNEQVQDIVGNMFSGNTETRISATYQDGDGTIDLAVDAIPVDLTVDGAGTVHANNYTDTNTQLSDEQVQDIVGGMFSGNTETLCTVTYQDGDGTVDVVVDNDLSNYDNSSSGFITSTLTTEQVQDIVGGMFSGNTETRISATYQDGDGTIDLVADDMTANTMGSGFTVSATTDTTATTITEGDDLFFAAGTGITCETTADGTVTITNTVSDTNTQLSDEQVQDIVGGMFSGNTETLCTVTYQDGDGTIDLVVDNDLSNYDNSSSGFITATLTTEQVQDIVGGMFSGNTETRISATYQDGDGTIDLAVDDMTANDNTTYGISCVDGDNSDEEKIRLTGSDSSTDDIVLEAGTGLSIARSSDKITFTNTVSASTDVTLAGTPDYITISGQEITRNQIDLAADVTGVLPSANLDSDTAHLSGSQTFTGTKTFNHIRPMVIEHSDPGTGVGDFKAADVAYFGGTTGMTTGKCYYLNSSGGWTIANADAEADASGLLAIALGNDSNSDGMLLRGMVTPYALAGTDDYGKKVYLRAQDGILTTAIPTTSGNIVRIVGYMLHDSDDAIFFCPDNTYVELA